jgi:hypothetical protein
MMQFVLEEPSGSSRPVQPVGFGLPLPKGLIPDQDHLSILDADGSPLLVQREVLGIHPGGSPRWVFVQFVTSLKAREKKTFTVKFIKNARTRASHPLSIREGADEIHIDTGEIAFDLPKSGFALPQNLKLRDSGPLLAEGARGFRAVDENGKEFFTGLDTSSQVTIIERGPIRALLHFQGKHRSEDGAAWLNYDVWCSAFAGSPILALQYRILNFEQVPMRDGKPIYTEKRERVLTTIRELNLDLRTGPLKDSQMLMGGSDKPSATVVPVEPGARLEQPDFKHYTLKGPKRGYPGGAQSLGWASIAGESGGVSVILEEFAQNYPKALAIETSRIRMYIYPPTADPLKLPRGSAKTHNLFLRFHAREEPAVSLSQALACLDAPTAILPPEWYVRTGVLEDIFPPNPEKYPNLEAAFRTFLPGRYGGMTGILDVGDFGEPWYKYNNEYDLSHSYFLLFARSGERNYLKFVEKCTLHTMDQDFAHYSPVRLDDGGVYIHGGKHNDTNVQIDHIWVQGTLDRYFFLGDREALRIARRIGDNAILKVTESPYRRATERAAGWPLILLCALYEATLEQKYLDGAAVAVQTTLEWQDPELGHWPHVLNEDPLYRGGVSFMTGILLDGLAHYYLLTGEERVKQSFLRGVNWLIDHARFPDGSFYWKASPRLQTPTATVLVFPAFAHAWQFTGKRKYLEEIRVPFMMSRTPKNQGAMGNGMYLRSIFELLQALDEADLLEDLKRGP